MITVIPPKRIVINSILVVCLLCLLFLSQQDGGVPDRPVSVSDYQQPVFRRPQPAFSLPESKTLEKYGLDIWITMAVCWSGNTHYWGKDKFPYKEAAPLSARVKINGPSVY